MPTVTANPRRRLVVALTLCSLVPTALMPVAAAGSPPPGWTNERLLSCDGQEVLTALTPAGFGTPFHVVDSPDVIIPKHVEVVFTPGTDPVVTLDVPGFDPTGDGVVLCEYVDPVGLAVEFSGLRV
ncbi:hypothetical protein LL946_09730 [Knoellia locipacati]|uniref:hypothetical protein n=1 Tax=Knoellia locipacati TaxID=882824 RepID=UPI00384AFFDF